MYSNSKYNQQIAERIFLNKLDECEYFPKYFTIETCNSCNAKCLMCPKSMTSTEGLELMSDELFEKLIYEITPYNNWIEMVCLNSDGEPTLDKKLCNRIRKLKNIGIKCVNFSTNAQLLDYELGKNIIESGLDDIRISIDSIDKYTFEKVRKGLDFNRVLKNILNFIELRNNMNSKIKIRIRMVEIEENKSEVEEWLKYWQSRLSKNDKAQVMPMHTWSGSIVNENKSNIEYYSDKPCVSVFSSFALNFNGLVQLCDSDINQNEIVGDFNIASILEIWNGSKLREVRKLHSSSNRNKIPICMGCNHWDRGFIE